MNRRFMGRKNWLLLGATIVLFTVPLYFNLGYAEAGGAEPFSGSDAQAEEAIRTVSMDYKPWFASVWTPPSGEIESLLFGLQAALGAGGLCYCLGYYRGRRRAGGTAP